MVISSQNEMMKIDSSLLDIMMDKTILVLLRTSILRWSKLEKYWNFTT